MLIQLLAKAVGEAVESAVARVHPQVVPLSVAGVLRFASYCFRLTATTGAGL